MWVESSGMSNDATLEIAGHRGKRGASGEVLDLVVIGGGISGLATAYYARKAWAAREGRHLAMAVLEQSSRPGGKIQTETVEANGLADRFVIEAGPDSFLTQKPWAMQLARELGMEAEMIGTNDHRRKIFVLQNGGLVRMPEGLQLIVPTRLWPFALSPLISPWGKLRMALDLILPARKSDADETLAEFVTRRLGREALDKLAEPLMSGIYSAEADRQSILATFPRFREMEREHGSLIRGILAANRKRQQPTASSGNRPTAVFMTPIQGTGELIRRLAQELGEAVVVDAGVTTIERAPASGEDSTAAPAYSIGLADGRVYRARAVVVAAPAGPTADLLAPLSPVAAELLRTIRHVSTVTLTFAYGPGQIAHPMDGFGVVIPHSEGRRINAITWTSSKFDHRAPPDHRLIRVFLGGSRHPGVLKHSDDELIAIAKAELKEIMGVDAQPLFHRLFRWVDASPQYDVGHLGRVDRIEAALPANLFVTGSPYRGIGIPDCVHQAQQTAQRVADALETDAVETGALETVKAQ